MIDNKMKEVKDKVSGSVKEATGKATSNKRLELEGKFQKGKGKAREVAGNVTDEMEVVKDKVVGGVKEMAGKFSDDEILQLRGKLQKSKEREQMVNNIIIGLGVIAGLYLIKTIISRNEN